MIIIRYFLLHLIVHKRSQRVLKMEERTSGLEHQFDIN